MLLSGLFNSPLLGNAFAVVPFVPENIPAVDDRQAKCLMKTLKSLTSIVNVFVPPLKPTLLRLLKSQAFSLPSISGVSFGKLRFKHVNIQSAICQHGHPY